VCITLPHFWSAVQYLRLLGSVPGAARMLGFGQSVPLRTKSLTQVCMHSRPLPALRAVRSSRDFQQQGLPARRSCVDSALQAPSVAVSRAPVVESAWRWRAQGGGECSEPFLHALNYSQVAGLIAGMVTVGMFIDKIGRKWGSVTTAGIMFVGARRAACSALWVPAWPRYTCLSTASAFGAEQKSWGIRISRCLGHCSTSASGDLHCYVDVHLCGC